MKPEPAIRAKLSEVLAQDTRPQLERGDQRATISKAAVAAVLHWVLDDGADEFVSAGPRS